MPAASPATGTWRPTPPPDRAGRGNLRGSPPAHSYHRPALKRKARAMTKFDLDALVREAEGDPFVFTFDGDDYELAPQPDVRAVAALSAGRLDDALRMLL